MIVEVILIDISYHSEESLYEEEYEIQGNDHQYGKFSLDESANQPKFEQEGLPYQEEEPEDEAEMHDHLYSTLED